MSGCNTAWICRCFSIFLLVCHGHIPEHVCHDNMHFAPSRTLCFKGAQGHSGRPTLHPYICSALQVSFARDASAEWAPVTHQSSSETSFSTQLSYSRSRVPVCLRVLPVPERVPCQPYPCHCCFPSSPTRPLLLVFIQVYRAELPIACQCQRFDAFPLVNGRPVQESNSFSNSSAQSAQRYFQLSSTFSVYLQICNYPSLSASHICFLRGSSQSVCLRVAFECHFGVLSLTVCHSDHAINQFTFYVFWDSSGESTDINWEDSTH